MWRTFLRHLKKLTFYNRFNVHSTPSKFILFDVHIHTSTFYLGHIYKSSAPFTHYWSLFSDNNKIIREEFCESRFFEKGYISKDYIGLVTCMLLHYIYWINWHFLREISIFVNNLGTKSTNWIRLVSNVIVEM